MKYSEAIKSKRWEPIELLKEIEVLVRLGSSVKEELYFRRKNCIEKHDEG